MKENTFNTYLKNSFNLLNSYRAYKMSDAPNDKSIKKPYDLFCHYKTGFIAVEGKRLKGLTALNFSKFEEQQIPELMSVFQNGHLALIAVYIEIPRHSYLLLFSADIIPYFVKKSQKSILKKHFEQFNDYEIPLRKKLFNLNDYNNKIITIDKWEEIIGS